MVDRVVDLQLEEGPKGTLPGLLSCYDQATIYWQQTSPSSAQLSFVVYEKSPCRDVFVPSLSDTLQNTHPTCPHNPFFCSMTSGTQIAHLFHDLWLPTSMNQLELSTSMKPGLNSDQLASLFSIECYAVFNMNGQAAPDIFRYVLFQHMTSSILFAFEVIVRVSL